MFYYYNVLYVLTLLIFLLFESYNVVDTLFAMGKMGKDVYESTLLGNKKILWRQNRQVD